MQLGNPCILSALALLRRINCDFLYPFPPGKSQHRLPLEFTTTTLYSTSSQPRAPITVTAWKTRPIIRRLQRGPKMVVLDEKYGILWQCLWKCSNGEGSGEMWAPRRWQNAWPQLDEPPLTKEPLSPEETLLEVDSVAVILAHKEAFIVQWNLPHNGDEVSQPAGKRQEALQNDIHVEICEKKRGINWAQDSRHSFH